MNEPLAAYKIEAKPQLQTKAFQISMSYTSCTAYLKSRQPEKQVTFHFGNIYKIIILKHR